MSASLGTLKDVETLVERLLTCIEPVDASHHGSWGGKAFQLSWRDGGPRPLSIALLHILSHRWLPTLRYGLVCVIDVTQADQPQWHSYGRGFATLRSPTLFLGL